MISVEGNIFRGPHVELADLAASGIKAVLCLESNAIGDLSPLAEEMQADAAGIRVYNSPLSGIIPPSFSELVEIARFLRDQDQKGIPTYVHCRWGLDRTGMVIAAYRIWVCHWSAEQAIQEMFNNGMHWAYRLYWPLVLHEVERTGL